jgi:hypothetical protein
MVSVIVVLACRFGESHAFAVDPGAAPPANADEAEFSEPEG